MNELVRTAHMVFTREGALPIVRVTRTSVPIATADAYEEIARELDRILPEHDRRRLKLLADFRAAPLRNDPEFEKMMTPYIERLFGAFAKRAVLVKTAVGRLHVGRTSREAGMAAATSTFIDENEAIAYLLMPG